MGESCSPEAFKAAEEEQLRMQYVEDKLASGASDPNNNIFYCCNYQHSLYSMVHDIIPMCKDAGDRDELLASVEEMKRTWRSKCRILNFNNGVAPSICKGLLVDSKGRELTTVEFEPEGWWRWCLVGVSLFIAGITVYLIITVVPP